MTHPLYSDINLTGIKSQLIEELDNETNIPIPETFPIATNLLKDFNNRCFNSTNINDILSLCDYLMIDNTETFVKYNMEPDTKEYILTGYHMIHYNIPKQTFEEMTIENMVCHKLKKYICLLAGKYGHLDILIWTRSVNCDWSLDPCNDAIIYEHLDMLKYVIDNGCIPNSNICTQVVRIGNIDILKYLHNIGCIMHEDNLCEAIQYNHMDIVIWLRSIDYEWQSKMYNIVAYNGHLDMLKYIHNNGCPLPTTIMLEKCLDPKLSWKTHSPESILGRKQCLQYLITNDCYELS
jgi:hypothetical protein